MRKTDPLVVDQPGVENPLIRAQAQFLEPRGRLRMEAAVLAALIPVVISAPFFRFYGDGR